ncbi:13876_t:CDS:1, partial [Dentiscutata erythropus]
SYQFTNLHKEVSLATRVGKATIDCVIAEFNKNRVVIASEQGHRYSRALKTEYVKAIQDLILIANKH